MALLQCSWGRIQLWLASITTTDGRDVVITPYTRGNVPDVDDRGEPPKLARCSLLFDDFIGVSATAEDRLQDLLLLKSKGKAQLFVHPIYGSYLANIVDFDHTIVPPGIITAEASFVPAEEVGVFAVDPLGVSLDFTTDAIDASATELTAQLADVEDTSALPAQATAAGEAIESAETARDALVEVSRMSDALWDEIDEKKLALDTALWPAMKAYVMLGEAVRAGADRRLGDGGAFMTVRIDEPQSLWRLVTDIYGADQAFARREEAMSLNDIPTPGAIPSGTQLRLRQPDRA